MIDQKFKFPYDKMQWAQFTNLTPPVVSVIAIKCNQSCINSYLVRELLGTEKQN